LYISTKGTFVGSSPSVSLSYLLRGMAILSNYCYLL
jgi:hypothetical protein